MKLQHLRFFVAVVDHGGVVKAAQHLNVSQPSVSMALRSLEKELGRPLFERPGGSHKLRPTQSALSFHQHALEILRRCDVARTEFQTRRGPPTRLRVGVLNTIAAADVMATAAVLHQQGDLEIQLWEGGISRIRDWFQAKRVDALWTTLTRAEPNSRLLWKEPFAVLASPAHHLAREARLRVADLNAEPFILRSSCELTSGQLLNAGFSPKVVARAERDELALQMVSQGVGLVVAPTSIATERVIALPVTDLKLKRSIGVRWRPNIPKPAITRFLDAVDLGKRAR